MSQRIIFLTIVVLSIFLSGCYDSTEIDSLASVVAVGIEKNGEDGIRYTFAFANTSDFSDGGADETENRRICFDSCADGADAAVKETERKISKKISLSHMALILFSDECSEKDIGEAVEYFGSVSRIRPQTLVAVSRFSPEKFFDDFSTVTEVNVEKYFYGIFKNTFSGKTSFTVGDCIDAVRCEGSIRLPMMSLNDDGNELSIIGTTSVDFKK